MASMEELERILNCTMCNSLFQDPCTLECGHSFCSGCVADTVQSNVDLKERKVLRCSLCKHETKVLDPEKPVSEWPKQLGPNFVIQRLVEQMSDYLNPEPAKCSICTTIGEELVASTWCPKCDHSLCQRCSAIHRVTPATIEHELLEPDRATRRRYNKRKCTEHPDSLKDFYCRDCKEQACQVCCMTRHRRCDNVVTLESMVPEMKAAIQAKRKMMQEKLRAREIEKKKLQSALAKNQKTREDILASEEMVVKAIKEEYHDRIRQVNLISEREKNRVKGEMQATEVQIQMFEAHKKYIEEVMASGDVEKLQKAQEICKKVDLLEATPPPEDTGPDPIKQIEMLADKKELQKVIDKYTLGTLTVTYEDCDAVRFEPEPVRLMNLKLPSDKASPLIQDMVYVSVGNLKVVVVTDSNNKSVKSFSTDEGNNNNCSLMLSSGPHGIIHFGDDKVMVAVPLSRTLVTLSVDPFIDMKKTIRTPKPVNSLGLLYDGKIVAGCGNSNCIDILDISGNTVQTLRSFYSEENFAFPGLIQVTHQDQILVSDLEKNTVTCLNRDLDIIWTYPADGKTASQPLGITTTVDGKTLVSDGWSRKIVVLKSSGEKEAEVLTEDNGLKNPWVIDYDKCDFLYVVDHGDNPKLLVYKFLF